ncbi:MAG: ATP-binding protein, partial [Pseudonocardia sp.]
MAGVASRGRRRAALPAPPNALVGRDVEVAALVGLITAADTRLLTLTGPPGVGKTRLAVAAAAATAAAEHFADGVAFVDLTAVRDPAAVAGALGGVLGAGGTGAADAPGHLDGTRADPELLVVLDNFEHVLDAGPALAAVLADSVRLRVLVTSRERLRLRAEREFSVQPLGLPDPGDDADRVAETSAVAMLVQRVRAFRPEFAVTTANRDAVAEICVRLDGLPLALELAAARLRLFTPGELTFRLRHRMTVLASSIRDVPERHRTLRAALSWSHDLLTPPERVAFRRFSVFVGGATIEAVEQACGGDRVVDDVMSLVDKSLLERRTHGDRTRFVMLESLREFAGELLDEPAGGPTRLQHARFYAALAARTEAVIGTADETASIADAGVEQGNLRAALECALAAGQAEWALRLAAALGWYYYTRGRLGEANATLDRAVAAADLVRGTVPEDPLGAALLISGVVAYGRGELDGAAERLGRCGRFLARTGDLRLIAISSAFLGHLARARG